MRTSQSRILSGRSESTGSTRGRGMEGEASRGVLGVGRWDDTCMDVGGATKLMIADRKREKEGGRGEHGF